MSNIGKQYVTIKLPIEIVNEIDEMIGKHGFRSRGEFVKEAVRRLLDYYGGRE